MGKLNAAELNQALARLTVRAGANVEPGQDVYILPADLEHAPLVRDLTEEAYRAGARMVSVLWWDPALKRSRIAHAPKDSLSFVPGWCEHFYDEIRACGGAYIEILDDPDPDVLDGLDPELAALDQMPVTSRYMDILGSGEIRWTAVFAPTPGLARRMLGSDDVEQLWEVIAPILRLDTPDPGRAWAERVGVLSGRTRELDGRAFSGLHFHGPGTDLRLGLMPGTKWKCALSEVGGRECIANLPSEEVFTTPDRRRADGVVKMTWPIPLVGGPNVEGATLVFEDGRVVKAEAETNVDELRARIGRDDSSDRLGEVALVDSEGPIFKAGRVFNDIILDENAACHIALGHAYGFTVPGLPEEKAAREERGFNVSAIHQDMMLGSREVAVDGIDADGRAVPILADGRWVLAAE